MEENNAIFIQNMSKELTMIYQNELVGRTEEIAKLKKIIDSPKAEFVAVFGRRRIGKTFLIKSLFRDKFAFYATAVANMNFRGQLQGFNNTLARYFEGVHSANNWMDAFEDLRTCLETKPEGPKIIFLDELPWFDTARSNFVSALEYFWNSWASDQKDIKLIVCGSATSWLLNKVINSRGGLHNRVTHQIHLAPFTLAECKEYFAWRGFTFENRDIALCYMVMGGVPFYLSQMETGMSVAQNIDNIFFKSGAELFNEFHNLYAALFKQSELHTQIVSALAQKAKGLTRNELLKALKIESSGIFSKTIEELESCDFIRTYTPFGKQKKDGLIQLVDFYTLFYFKFIKENKRRSETFWSSMQNSSVFSNWSGYSFEMLCLHHITQLKRALKIEGLQSLPCSWSVNTENGGAQIDLILDRADNVLNLCEMKFTKKPFVIDNDYAKNLDEKMDLFREQTHTKKTLMWTLVSAEGLKPNPYIGRIQNLVTLDDLFK